MTHNEKSLKRFYSVGEVAEQVGISESTLRFWEKEFPRIIKPHKAGRGIRQYTEEDIQQVHTIYQLVKVRGLTLEGARQALKRGRNVVDKQQAVIDRLTAVKEELLTLSKELSNTQTA